MSDRMRASRAVRVGVMVLAAALGLGGCLGEPFAHRNPYDPGTEFTLELIRLTDTVFTVGVVVEFQLVATPTISELAPEWASSPSIYVQNIGGGQFQVMQLPPTPLTVSVSGGFGARRAFSSFVVMPP